MYVSCSADGCPPGQAKASPGSFLNWYSSLQIRPRNRGAVPVFIWSNLPWALPLVLFISSTMVAQNLREYVPRQFQLPAKSIFRKSREPACVSKVCVLEMISENAISCVHGSRCGRGMQSRSTQLPAGWKKRQVARVLFQRRLSQRSLSQRTLDQRRLNQRNSGHPPSGSGASVQCRYEWLRFFSSHRAADPGFACLDGCNGTLRRRASL